MKKYNFYFYFLSIYVFFLLCFTIFNYQTISEWALVEILINYQGGFVRRGLLGEINFINKDLFDSYYPILPIIIIGFFYLINFFIVIILSLKLKKNNFLIFLLILLSPATILFNVYDVGALFRKDVFFITVILFHSFLINSYFEDKIKINTYKNLLFFVITPFLSINILIHEAQIFFILPHILLSVLVFNDYKKNYKIFFTYIFPIIFFLIIFFNKGDGEIISGIKNSLSYYPSEIINKPYNPIHYLEGNIFLMIGNSIKLFFWYNYENTIQLLITFVLSFYLFWYLFKNIYKQNYSLLDKKGEILKKNFFKKLTFIFLPIFGSLIVAIDFGRFFHLLTMHLIAIFLSFPNIFFEKKFHIFNKLQKSFGKIIIFFYFTLWVLPHGYVGYAGTSIYQSGFMKTNKKIISTIGLAIEKKQIIKIPNFMLKNFDESIR